jgi:hypothetical protein
MHRRELLGVYGIHAVLIHRRSVVPYQRPVPWMMKRCASFRSRVSPKRCPTNS